MIAAPICIHSGAPGGTCKWSANAGPAKPATQNASAHAAVRTAAANGVFVISNAPVIAHSTTHIEIRYERSEMRSGSDMTARIKSMIAGAKRLRRVNGV